MKAEPSNVPPTVASAPVSVHQAAITIPAYPYAPFLQEAFDERYNVSFWRLDREAYSGADKTLVDKSFTAIILENEYLRLTFLPELGGRLYQAVFKPTGQQLFYQNTVLKPSPWGPLAPEENWWLAAGGMEWAFPVDEHGYEWGVPWGYRVSHLNDGTARVTVWDTDAQDRPRMEVTVALRPGQASFSVHPRILNPLSRPISYQFWLNAMLTLGGTTAPADVRFVYPTTEMVVHSRGDDNTLPASGQSMSWPIYQGRNMARYSNWNTYLGMFAPDLQENFVAAYSPTTRMGVVRSFPRSRVSGVKLFGFGPRFSEWQRYTDDASRYFEIWGGAPRTFWEQDNAVLAPGGVTEWTEQWYPFTAIGPPVYANNQAAFSLHPEGGTLMVGLATTSPHQGTLSLTVGGEEVMHQTVQVRPETPVQRSVSLPAGVSESVPLTVRFVDQNGQLIAEYQGHID